MRSHTGVGTVIGNFLNRVISEGTCGPTLVSPLMSSNSDQMIGRQSVLQVMYMGQ